MQLLHVQPTDVIMEGDGRTLLLQKGINYLHLLILVSTRPYNQEKPLLRHIMQNP